MLTDQLSSVNPPGDLFFNSTCQPAIGSVGAVPGAETFNSPALVPSTDGLEIEGPGAQQGDHHSPQRIGLVANNWSFIWTAISICGFMPFFGPLLMGPPGPPWVGPGRTPSFEEQA